jgi:hypothetical protein
MIDTGSFLLCLIRFFLFLSFSLSLSVLLVAAVAYFCLSRAFALSLFLCVFVLSREYASQRKTHRSNMLFFGVNRPWILKKNVFSVSHSLFLLLSCRWRHVRLHQYQCGKRLGISREHWSSYFTDISIIFSLSLALPDPVNQLTIAHRGCVWSRLFWLFFDSSGFSNQRARLRTELTVN